MKKVKRILALVLAMVILAGVPTYIQNKASAETPASVQSSGPVEVVSAALTDDLTAIRIQFSGEVNLTDGGFTAIRLLDNMTDQNLQWDGETPLQWSGVFVAVDGDKTCIDFKLHAGHGIALNDLLIKLETKYPQYVIAVGREDGTGTISDSLIDSITDNSGNPVKATMPRSWADQLYIEAPAASITRLVSSEIINDTQVRFTFSDEVHLADNGNGFVCCRLLNDMVNQDLIWDDPNTGIGTSGTWPQQWSGAFSSDPDNANCLIFTAGISEYYGGSSISTHFNYYTAIFPQFEVAFGIEDYTGTNEDGKISYILDKNNNPVQATRARSWADQLYSVPTNSLTVDAVKAYVNPDNEDQIIIQFDEPVVINSADGWDSVRIIDNMTSQNLRNYIGGENWEQYGVSLAVNPNDETQIIATGDGLSSFLRRYEANLFQMNNDVLTICLENYNGNYSNGTYTNIVGKNTGHPLKTSKENDLYIPIDDFTSKTELLTMIP